VSNVLDRVFYHGVIDFIKISVGDYIYPIFNVADMSITLGSVLLVWFMLLSKKN
jgi:signal peptidase II